jgi:hypothetical protein
MKKEERGKKVRRKKKVKRKKMEMSKKRKSRIRCTKSRNRRRKETVSHTILIISPESI